MVSGNCNTFIEAFSPVYSLMAVAFVGILAPERPVAFDASALAEFIEEILLLGGRARGVEGGVARGVTWLLSLLDEALEVTGDERLLVLVIEEILPLRELALEAALLLLSGLPEGAEGVAVSSEPFCV
jgi:hypothetical protein